MRRKRRAAFGQRDFSTADSEYGGRRAANALLLPQAQTKSQTATGCLLMTPRHTARLVVVVVNVINRDCKLFA